MSVDDAISGDRTVIKKAAEKILEYAVLTIEIQRMWNLKMNVIPVIRGETGTISNSFIKHFNNAPGEHKIKEPQKISRNGHSTHTAGSKDEDKAITLQALDRPFGIQGDEASRISRHSALEGRKFLKPTHQPSLPPGYIPDMCVLEPALTPGP